MTNEELQAEIERLTQANAALTTSINEANQKNEQLETNQKNQNAYITKLEAKSKEQPVVPASLSDKALTAYIQKHMRSDTYNEAKELILKNTSSDIFDCLEPELIKFLDANMTIDKTSTKFILDAFSLKYGQALTNPGHAIHKLGQSPENTPSPQQDAQQPVQQSQQVQPPQQVPVESIAQQLRQSLVPGMTPSDNNAAQTPPQPRTPIANTEDAMKAFKEKARMLGANKFS